MARSLSAAIFALVCLLSIGCSTTGNFKIPQDHTLMVTDRQVNPNADGEFETSPFFWSETSGIDYRLMDKNGNVVRSGKLKSKFRVVSIFWPPAALIYWPMGFHSHGYDLTRPGDGYYVVDSGVPASIARPSGQAGDGEPEVQKVPAKKSKKQ